MPKSASPVRLQRELMESASLAGARQHRSTSEQIEYWAALGQKVAQVLNPDVLLDVMSGLAHLKVEPIAAAAVNPELVFAAVEAAHRSGELPEAIGTGRIRYQASATHAGLLERIAADGSRSDGRFENGVFLPCDIRAA